jgi:hypothetical protein
MIWHRPICELSAQRPAKVRVDEAIWTLEFDRKGSLTSWSQSDLFGMVTMSLSGSGSASPSTDGRFAWELNLQCQMVYVQISQRFWVARSGEVYGQTLLGLGEVGEADFGE